MPELLINTSNLAKQAEFRRLLKNYAGNLRFTEIDLPEVDSDDPAEVAIQKARLAAHADLREGQVTTYGRKFKQAVVVEDTSLDIEGIDLGVKIRWLLERDPLGLGSYAGKACIFRCIIAVMTKNDEILLATGEVHGTICLKQGNQGFGFDPYIIPNGRDQSLAEDKPDEVNARALALNNFCNHKFQIIHRDFGEWKGAWQNGKAPTNF